VGLTLETIVIGIVGVIVGITGLIISFYSLISGAKQSYEEIVHKPKPKTEEKNEEEPEMKKKDLISEFYELKKDLSLSLIKQEKNLLAVLVYLVIGEFGVFS